MTGGLGSAALVALSGAGLPAAGSAGLQVAADDRAETRIWLLPPEGGSGMGPLVIPTIGALPPGDEDWFLPGAPTAGVPRPVPPDPGDAGGRPAPPSPSPSPTQTPERSHDDPGEPLDEEPAGDPVPAAVEATPSPGPTSAPSASPDPASSPPLPAPAPLTTPASPAVPPPGEPPTEPPAPPSTEPPPTETPEPPPTEPQPTEAPEPPPTETPEPPPTETPEPAVVLVPGAPLEVRDPATSDLVLTVTVEEVLPGVSCADAAVVPSNGSLVAVRITVTTGADLSALGSERSVAAGDFRLVGDDGTVVAGGSPAGVCDTGAAPFPAAPLGPTQELTGTVVLDVPGLSGTVLYRPGWLAPGDE
ncbi:hypothetical protein ACI799_10210 [Blastococcus sp. SYSU DS0753]